MLPTLSTARHAKFAHPMFHSLASAVEHKRPKMETAMRVERNCMANVPGMAHLVLDFFGARLSAVNVMPRIYPLRPLNLLELVNALVAAMRTFPREGRLCWLSNFFWRWRFAKDSAAIAICAIYKKIPLRPLDEIQLMIPIWLPSPMDIRGFTGCLQDNCTVRQCNCRRF